MSISKTIKAATMFSGIGAPECAMPHWDWLWHAEIEPHPKAVLAARHPGSVNLGDVNAEDFVERALKIGRPDVIVFGSPCQDFSVAGQRVGLDGSRGNMALVAVGIVAKLRPRWLAFENVPGLLSSYSGASGAERSVREGDVGGRTDGSEDSDFAALLSCFQECGYLGCYRITDAQFAGVPQRRRRVFFVGSLGDWRPAAAVLLEPHSLRRHSPPSRATRKGTSGSPRSSIEAGGIDAAKARPTFTGGIDREDMHTIIPAPVPLSGVRRDQRSDVVADVRVVQPSADRACPGNRHVIRNNAPDDVAWALQERDAKGPDSDTKQGHLIVAEVAPTLIAFSCKDYGGDASVGVTPTLRSMERDEGNANAGGQLAVCFQPRIARNGRGQPEEVTQARPATCAPVVAVFKPSHFTPGKDGAPSDVASPLGADVDKGDQDQVLLSEMAVRRLTPVECERLRAVWRPEFLRGRSTLPVARQCHECSGGPWDPDADRNVRGNEKMSRRKTSVEVPFAVPGWPAASVKMWKIDRIIPYPQNAKNHPPEQVTLLADLMRKFGVDQPIVVDENGVILKGHGRRLAAIEARFEEFPVVQHVGLSEDDKIALRLADNQVPLLGGWNDELIKGELEKLKLSDYPMALLGFAPASLAGWLDTTEGHTDPEATPEPPKVPIVRAGDLWCLGRHRLLCGDSTKADDVARVLDGAEPHLMVTDPPYGVNYDPNWRNEPGKQSKTARKAAAGKVVNDHQSEWSAAWELFPGDVAYVWHGERQSPEIVAQFPEFDRRNLIVWVKDVLVISRGHYHPQHETCWYLVRKGKTARWSGDRKQSTTWFINRNRRNETGHGTQKPVECMKRPIENNSKPGDDVYEPFSGSGTTIVAGEMTGRRVLAIELDPTYVQVAIERWQQFAKQQATLDGVPFEDVAAARRKGEPKRKRQPVKAGAPAVDGRKVSSARRPQPST